jgi:UDP-N-acetylmuramyl pentapeptide synthase
MAEMGAESDRIHWRTGERLGGLSLTELLAVGEGTEALVAGFRAAGGKAQHFASKEEAAAWLAAELAVGDCLLVKASRVAALESVIALLRQHIESASKAE